ncbi:acyl-CoA dehydrogenase family protein [Phyllobacterium myrsinacearum]|uniref:Alkylation response protein AidB-like acyl-CoA dehydrogenase n=1 Tax=Phyllobacterium myrsinacearum TaxID=28101 RepID=A0A839ERY9_9HYPH|nr:acyl-CoA dehydrogenase family protein [Phyllobacterium myrsinacearum]MBA8880136.1 alkylation response protein AidB-like acyl-CoA dehydrogenase [Phyllobacterium myrsinacearum]
MSDRSSLKLIHPASATYEDFAASALIIAEDLAKTGAERDREAGVPKAEIDTLRHAGLLTALHPKEIGGGGIGWADALRLVRIISRGESSIGQLLGYHYVNAYVPYIAANEATAHVLGVETVEKGHYWGAVVNPRDAGLTLTRADDGYRLNGRKTFSTAAHISNRINVIALLDGEVASLVLPTDRPGYFPADDWDNIGQRLSDSGSVEFRDYAVTEADFLVPLAAPDAPLPPLATFNTPLIQLVFVNFYLGTAEGALAQALDYVRTTTKPWETSGVSRAAEDPYILERFGEFSASLKASVALAENAALAVQGALAKGSAVTAQERGEAAIEAYHAKVHATHVALEITARVFELMGARATAARYGFDRYWRNVRTHTLHDPVFYKAREVGNFVLNGEIPQVSLYS